jgi:Holliday junction resolvase RusA-like endonuclease
MELIFGGRPVPWARVARGRTGKGFTPSRQRLHGAALSRALALAPDRQKFEGPVRLEVTFDYAKNETRIGIETLAPGRFWRTEKRGGDLDNLVKQVMEALQAAGIVEDDAQVALIIADKVE